MIVLNIYMPDAKRMLCRKCGGSILFASILAAKILWHLIDYGISARTASEINEKIRKRRREQCAERGASASSGERKSQICLLKSLAVRAGNRDRAVGLRDDLGIIEMVYIRQIDQIAPVALEKSVNEFVLKDL